MACRILILIYFWLTAFLNELQKKGENMEGENEKLFCKFPFFVMCVKMLESTAVWKWIMFMNMKMINLTYSHMGVFFPTWVASYSMHYNNSKMFRSHSNMKVYILSNYSIMFRNGIYIFVLLICKFHQRNIITFTHYHMHKMYGKLLC